MSAIISKGPRTAAADHLHAMKYRAPGESFREAMNRVACALKDDDKHFRALRDLLMDQRFVPAGRVQASMGLSKAVTAYNCFVSMPIVDSFVDDVGCIMDRAKEAATTMRMGGGIGYDFSTLRPRGDLIRKLASHASGPVSFMRIFNAVCLATSSSGHRRGAQMAVLRVDHPSIEEFIKAKQNTNELTGFNISVAVTDEFMDAALNHKPFTLRFNDRPYSTIDAAALWESIMRSTWDWGEPGVLFIDRINQLNNLWYCEEISTSNPCFSGDTKVWTSNGPITFSDLAKSSKMVNVLTQLEDGTLAYRPMLNPRMTRRTQRLVKVTLRGLGKKSRSVTEVKCTDTHEFFLKDGRKICAKELKCGDHLASVYRGVANQKGYLKLRGTYDNVFEHHVAAECVYGRRPNYPLEHVHHVNGNKQDNRPENVEIILATIHNSDNMKNKNNSGLMKHPVDNRGEKNPRWRDDIDEEAINLLYEQGFSYAAIANEMNCSKYTVMKRLGWERPNHVVIKVEYTDQYEDVFCGTVPTTGKFFIECGKDEGVLVSNCAEQPLPPGGSCLLGSFNLVKYITKNEQDDLSFDFKQLREDIPVAVRALDNVIDRTIYPLEAQRQEAASKRRMGIGVMGLANCLETLGTPYGTPSFLASESSILEWLMLHAYEASALLAHEKGAFPLFSKGHYLDGHFVARLPKDIRELIADCGIRNSHLLSIAPTGTISQTCDNVSGGIEPVWQYRYQRPVNTPGGSAIYDIEDYAMATYGVKGRLAHEVSPLEHVDVLTTAQQYVDSSISKTINVSHDTEWSAFKDVYRQAWENGAKSCATFTTGGQREGLLQMEGAACRIDEKTGERSCGD